MPYKSVMLVRQLKTEVSIMQTKLTVRVDDELISAAKAYAAKTGRNLSQLIAAYFEILIEEKPEAAGELPPLTKSLKGVLKNSRVQEKDYKRYLKEKHK